MTGKPVVAALVAFLTLQSSAAQEKPSAALAPIRSRADVTQAVSGL
jgi:hypothetical protein